MDEATFATIVLRNYRLMVEDLGTLAAEGKVACVASISDRKIVAITKNQDGRYEFMQCLVPLEEGDGFAVGSALQDWVARLSRTPEEIEQMWTADEEPRKRLILVFLSHLTGTEWSLTGANGMTLYFSNAKLKMPCSGHLKGSEAAYSSRFTNAYLTWRDASIESGKTKLEDHEIERKLPSKRARKFSSQLVV